MPSSMYMSIAESRFEIEGWYRGGVSSTGIFLKLIIEIKQEIFKLNRI